jgi:hypothetical protein
VPGSRVHPDQPAARNRAISAAPHDYYRHETVTLFAALDYLRGKVPAHTRQSGTAPMNGWPS